MKSRLIPMLLVTLVVSSSGCLSLMGTGCPGPMSGMMDTGIGGGGFLAGLQESRLQRMQARANARKAYLDSLQASQSRMNVGMMGSYAGGFGSEYIGDGMMMDGGFSYGGEMGGECSSCGDSHMGGEVFSNGMDPQFDPGFQNYAGGGYEVQSQGYPPRGLQNAPMPPNHRSNLTPTPAAPPMDAGANSEYQDAPQSYYTPHSVQDSRVIQTGMSVPVPVQQAPQYAPQQYQQQYQQQFSPSMNGSPIPSQPLSVPPIHSF